MSQGEITKLAVRQKASDSDIRYIHQVNRGDIILFTNQL